MSLLPFCLLMCIEVGKRSRSTGWFFIEIFRKVIITDIRQHKSVYNLVKFKDTKVKCVLVVAISYSEHIFWDWGCAKHFSLWDDLSLKFCHERQLVICIPSRNFSLLFIQSSVMSMHWWVSAYILGWKLCLWGFCESHLWHSLPLSVWSTLPR